MENEEHAHFEAEHWKEIKIFKGEVARLTTLLEQALKTRYVEALVTHTTVTPHPTTKAPFQLQNPT